MGFFGKKKDKSKRGSLSKRNEASSSPVAAQESATSSTREQEDTTPQAHMAMLPTLMEDLATCVETSGDKPARALRMLFSLSEDSQNDNRTEMVRRAGGMLVPELLCFLQRCARGSSEQYLALLVLNNISIPSENKRLIALDCGGAQVFCRLLCADPSCHLMAIILTNLTFCDADLRKELVSPKNNVELVESLCYSLRVASMTQDEYHANEAIMEEHSGESPSELLEMILANESAFEKTPINPSDHIFPETARWCLSALKHLSRPSKDPTTAHVLMKSGILKHMMSFIVVTEQPQSESLPPAKVVSDNLHSSSSESPLESDPLEGGQFTNAPTGWKSNSIQDAALFVILNLAATKASRDYVREELDSISVLSNITDFDKRSRREKCNEESDEQKQVEFQRLKARMALAYLIGSEGHFGQPRRRTNVYSDVVDSSAIILSETEVTLLLELLANTLAQRAKDGPGGYSAATFNVKWVLFAIRCLATNTLNQVQFTRNVKLNVLLINVLALHALQNSSVTDADAAEHAAFTLYLLSSYGFQEQAFLPGSYGSHDKIAGTGSLVAKILTSYIHKQGITPAGRHAADQLLLRLRYLVFRGSLSELQIPQKDYALDKELLDAAEAIIVEKRKHGARPNADIFDRPILRSRAPKRRGPRNNGSSVTSFPNALAAVEHLSFGSTKVRHMDAIDDILIANNIANSANGEKTESYNYAWSWQDAAASDFVNFQRSGDTNSMFSSFSSSFHDSSNNGPFAMFGCGSLCATDTTVENYRGGGGKAEI